MHAWIYWLGVAFCVAMFIAIPAVFWLEHRETKRNAELWDRTYGARR